MAEGKAQLEDGYTKIANTLIEAFSCLTLSTNETKVLFAVLRKTYGFNKKNDRISLSQISLLTRLQKTNVSRSLRVLIQRNIVIVSDNKIGLCTDISKWVSKLPRTITRKETCQELSSAIMPVIVSDNKSLSSQTPQNTKETITKESIPNGIRARRARLSGEEKKKRAEIMRTENDLMLAFLKSKIQLDDFTELQSEQRKWARNLVALFKKCGKQVCKDRLDSILSVPYKAQNCNSLIYIYKQIKGFKEPQNAIKTNFIS